jgi:predicted SprT family Zn-dependent metalloprotease
MLVQKTSDPTDAQFAAFRAMYDYFNRVMFAGELRPVLLNFSRHANSYGFFAPLRWEKGSESAHEISLNPSYLAARPPREVVATLVHEMVHCWQHEHGTPGRRGYHNDEWGQKMESLGLMPSSTGQPGGARRGERMSHYITEGGLFAVAFEKMPRAHLLPWLCSEATASARKRKASRSASKVKFTCPTCGANAWGRPALHLVCGDCAATMTAEDATDGEVALAAA